MIYEDINNDGSIDEYDIVYLGNSNPKLTGGFGTVVRYEIKMHRNLVVSLLIYFLIFAME